MSEDEQMWFARRLYLLLTLWPNTTALQLYNSTRLKMKRMSEEGWRGFVRDGSCVHDRIGRVEL